MSSIFEKVPLDLTHNPPLHSYGELTQKVEDTVLGVWHFSHGNELYR